MKPKKVISFKIKELQQLMNDPYSLVRAKRCVHHVALPPSSMDNMKNAVTQFLNELLHKFDKEIGGIILGYQNIQMTTDRGVIMNDDCHVHFDILADFYIFTPEVGNVLYGIAKKKSNDHIGCVVHKFFNVSILRPNTESSEEWPTSSVGIGDTVTFILKKCDFTGNLPYLQGAFISSSPSKEVNKLSSPKKKKHKKNHSSDEDSVTLPDLGQLFQLNKRKWNSDDETNINKKKGKKRKHERSSVDRPEEFHALHMSAEDPDYGQVTQHFKESYLKDVSVGEVVNKQKEKKKKHKKEKLHTTDLNQPTQGQNIENETKQKRKKKHKHEKEEGESTNEQKEKKKTHKKDLNQTAQNQNIQDETVGSEEIITKQKRKKKHKHEKEEESNLKGYRELWNKFDQKCNKLGEKSIGDKVPSLELPDDSEHKKKKEKGNKKSKISNTGSHEKREEIKVAHIVKDTSPLKTSNRISGEHRDVANEYVDNVLKGNLPRQISLIGSEDNFRIKTQKVSENFNDDDDSDATDPHVIDIGENSPFHKLGSNMVNSSDRERTKLGKSFDIPTRHSLPVLQPPSADDSDPQSDSLMSSPLTPFEPNSTSSARKPKRSAVFKSQDSLATPVKPHGDSSPSKMPKPTKPTTPDKKNRKQNKYQAQKLKEKVDGDNEFSSSGFTSPDLSKQLAVLSSPLVPSTPQSKEMAAKGAVNIPSKRKAAVSAEETVSSSDNKKAKLSSPENTSIKVQEKDATIDKIKIKKEKDHEKRKDVTKKKDKKMAKIQADLLEKYLKSNI